MLTLIVLALFVYSLTVMPITNNPTNSLFLLTHTTIMFIYKSSISNQGSPEFKECSFLHIIFNT